MTPLSCAQATRQFSAYLGGILSGAPRTNLEAHLDACLVCCDALAFSRAFDDFLKRQWEEAPVPESLEARVRLALDSRQSTQPGVRRTALYLDMHRHVEGLTAERAALAHRRDLEVQDKHGVKYLRYWYEEGSGQVFCLVEAPSKEAAAAVHREAHGFVADEIIEVKEGS